VAKLPVQEAAELLGVRPVHVWRRIRAGELLAEQDPASGVWLVEVEPDELHSGPGRSEEQDSIEAVAGLATELEREVLILREELRAYERQAEQLVSLRAVHQRTLGHVRDGSAAPASANDPSPETTQEPETEADSPSAEPGDLSRMIRPRSSTRQQRQWRQPAATRGNGGAPLGGAATAETGMRAGDGVAQKSTPESS
jgi:hypothetical protein